MTAKRKKREKAHFQDVCVQLEDLGSKVGHIPKVAESRLGPVSCERIPGIAPCLVETNFPGLGH